MKDTGFSFGKSGTVAIATKTWEGIEKQDTSESACHLTFIACLDAHEMNALVWDEVV